MDIIRGAAGKRKETNCRNAHNFSRNGHNNMVITAQLRALRAFVSVHENVLVCDATYNTHVMTRVMFHIIIHE